MTTKIQVNGLRMRGYHGVFDQERRVGNIFSYDVEVAVPWLEAAGADNVELTVSYADIAGVVRRVNEEPSRLLEHLALRLHDALCDEFPSVTSGRIRVAKLTPPVAGAEMDSAAVVIGW